MVFVCEIAQRFTHWLCDTLARLPSVDTPTPVFAHFRVMLASVSRIFLAHVASWSVIVVLIAVP